MIRRSQLPIFKILNTALRVRKDLRARRAYEEGI